jgi:prepilin-type N-terminal cleavage/methylation domain-containing protein
MQADRTPRQKHGFTLIELLVVVAIIALLISILLPSLQAAKEQAAAVVCMSNEHQIQLGSAMYGQEYRGFVPPNAWSEEAWGVDKADLWFYKIVPFYADNPDILICPSDPFADRYDFEAYNPHSQTPHNDARKASCGYGLNYVLRHFGEPWSFNIERYPPLRPESTILLAEVGPDEDPVREGFYVPGPNTGPAGRPWRDGGRLIWDDGERPWYQGYTWLTARHRGGINLTALDGSAKWAETLQLVNLHRGTGLEAWYENCASGGCTFCNPGGIEDYHYDFSPVGLYWWTGEIPDYPAYRP